MRVATWESMNAFNRSWANDSSEVTRPVDVLVLTGEHVTDDDDDDHEVFPLEQFLEDGWDDENGWDDGSPDISFFMVGGAHSVVRIPLGRGVVTQGQGVVKHLEEDRLLLGTPGISFHEVSLTYRLPASLDLRPLIGRRVVLTLEEEEAPSGGRVGQTLTVRTLDGRVWLVARCGVVREVDHALAGGVVRVSLSPKDGGPLVVATPDMQHIVAPGGEGRMRIGASRYVVELVSRDESGGAAYFIADDLLWH
jgi:hypothetical protein